MSDKREEILARLVVLLTAIPTLPTYSPHFVYRNRGELPEGKRPAIVILDGVEDNRIQYTGRGGTFMRSQVMSLHPQMFVLLIPRKLPDNAGVGEELSAYRKAIIKAIAEDRTLAHICGSNGQVQLIRTETDMQTGSTLEGQLRLDFQFDYTLDPSAL